MLSVVIITKNEAHIIANTLQSLQGLSRDIIIVDSGSTDDTLTICKKFAVTIIETSWEGYGENKNKGIAAAKNDWILSLDADEILDPTLRNEILKLNLQDENIVYKLRFLNFFCGKPIRFGVWASDYHIRIFNRKKVQWNVAEVHESLTLPSNLEILILKGYVLHHTVSNIGEYTSKMITYAKLSATKYHVYGRSPGFIKLYVAPGFIFFKNYFVRLGFLDGWEGFLICKTFTWYTFLKYAFLKEMIAKDKRASQ